MKKLDHDFESPLEFLLPYELKSYLIDFTRRFNEHGYALLSIESYIDSISHFGTWLNKQGVFIKDVSPEVLCDFSAYRCCCPGSRREHTLSKRYVSRIHNLIIYLHNKGIVNCRFDSPNNTLPLSKFSESLHLRGLSINTINRYTHSVNMILPPFANEPKDYDAKLVKQTVYTLSQRYDLAGLILVGWLIAYVLTCSVWALRRSGN
jgi:hypothetical protein